jgi:hypothetical protein
MTPEIESEYITLARAVIIQAARDAAGGDGDAAAWLASDETADLWFMVAGVRRSAVIAWIAKGCKVRAGVRLPGARTISQTKRPTAKRTQQTIPAMR